MGSLDNRERPGVMRIGQGYDRHRLVPGRPLVLGGITIPFDKGLEGHSDADALAHAITDALLGAAALGNIGQHFPDNDPRFKDAVSTDLLRQAATLLAKAGFRILNVDSTVVAQEPRLAPYLDAMRTRLAECIGLKTHQVSVKAKTGEGVGPEGRGEAVSAEAVVLIEEVVRPA